jgi:hypothetical protein
MLSQNSAAIYDQAEERIRSGWDHNDVRMVRR